MILHHAWRFERHLFHVLIKYGVILVDLDTVQRVFSNIDLTDALLQATREKIDTLGYDSPFYVMVPLDNLMKIVLRDHEPRLFRFCQELDWKFRHFKTETVFDATLSDTPMEAEPVNTPLPPHHLWHFEGHDFHVLIKDGTVLVELEKLLYYFPVLMEMNIPPSTYNLVLKKELGLKTKEHETPYHVVMISLDTLKTLVDSVYDVDLLRFWDQFYSDYHLYKTSIKVDEQPVKPRMSHQKAAALCMILHYRYGGWDETVNEQLYTLLEDYICFPYVHDEDITKSITIAVQAALYAPQRKRINDHLRHYFLGEDTN